MNKKRIAQYCCAALVAAGIGLNIQNAIADYGIGGESFSLLAAGGSNSNTGWWEDTTNKIKSYVSSCVSSYISSKEEDDRIKNEKTNKCVLKDTTETTSSNSSTTGSATVGAGKGPVSGSGTVSHTGGSETSNTYTVKRWVCEGAEGSDAELTSAECPTRCDAKNPKH